MVAEGARRQTDIGHDALVRVVVAVEDERAQRRGGVRCGRRDAVDDRLEHIGDAGAVLGTGQEHVLARDGEGLLELAHDHLGIGRWQVDLVDDRDDREVLRHRQVDVGEGLGLDPLAGVDDEDRALAGLERPAHLVREVDVPRRVDEVEGVGPAVGGVVVEADGPGLDRDPLLALELHRVEHLGRHLALVDRVGGFEQPVGEGRLPVVDVRDDAEVADALRGDHPRESSEDRCGLRLLGWNVARAAIAVAGGAALAVIGRCGRPLRPDGGDAVHGAVRAEVRCSGG